MGVGSSPRFSRAGTHRKSKGSMSGLYDSAARLSATDFPFPDHLTEGAAAFEEPPNGVAVMPHMQAVLDSLTFAEDSMGSHVKEARFRRAWFSARCQELITWFVWHTLNVQFQHNSARETFLFKHLAVAYGQIHTSDTMRPAAKDELTWHLPDAMARAAVAILCDAFPRSHAALGDGVRLQLRDRVQRWTASFTASFTAARPSPLDHGGRLPP